LITSALLHYTAVYNNGIVVNLQLAESDSLKVVMDVESFQNSETFCVFFFAKVPVVSTKAAPSPPCCSA